MKWSHFWMLLMATVFVILTWMPLLARGADFGVQYHCLWDANYNSPEAYYNNSTRVAVLDSMRRAGVRYVRIDLGFGGRPLAPMPMLDRCVAYANAYGMRVILNFVPQGVTPERAAAWASMLSLRYAGKVYAFEIGNEENWRSDYTDPAIYARTLDLSYAAVAHRALVVFGGTSEIPAPVVNDWGYSLDFDYVSRVLAFHPRYDVMAVHAYGIPDMLMIPQLHALDGKPVWITEFGNEDSEATQADYLARYAAQETMPYVQVLVWNKEIVSPGEGDFGLLRSDLSERPVYFTMKGLTSGATPRPSYPCPLRYRELCE